MSGDKKRERMAEMQLKMVERAEQAIDAIGSHQEIGKDYDDLWELLVIEKWISKIDSDSELDDDSMLAYSNLVEFLDRFERYIQKESVTRRNRENASQPSDTTAALHDRIERLGRQAAFDHEPHEITRTVRRSLRAHEKLSERQVRRVLQHRGVLQKRTQRR